MELQLIIAVKKLTRGLSGRKFNDEPQRSCQNTLAKVAETEDAFILQANGSRPSQDTIKAKPLRPSIDVHSGFNCFKV